MTWERRKSGPKIKKKPASSSVVFCNKSLSLHSLSTVLSATPSHAATSSSSTHSTTFIPLHRKLLLFSSTAAAAHQHHHFSFLPSPLSAAVAPTPPQMPPPASGQLPRPPPTSLQAGDNNCFSPSKVASHLTPPAATAKLHAERELTVHVLHIIHFTWVGSVLAQTKCLGRVQPSPQKVEKESMLGRYRPTVFWVYAWPSYLGWLGPPVLMIFN